MLNKPFKVLIGKDVARDADCVAGLALMVDGGLGYNKLATIGEILVLDKNKKILAEGATIADSDIIYIGQVTSETYSYTNESGTAVTGAYKILFSDPIEGALVKKYTATSYVAKSEQATTFTFTSLVVTAGTELVLRIVYKDMQEQAGGAQFVHTYHYTTVTGETVDTAAVALAALVNAHKGRRVVASVSAGSDYFILTGLPVPEGTTGLNDIDEFKQVEFDAYLNYVDSDGYQQETLATQATVAAVRGNGTWELVRDAEKAAKGYKGFTNQTHFPVLGPEWSTVKDETYDAIVIEHSKSYIAPDNTYTKTTPLKTIIFLPDGASQTANVLACLNPWMASCPGAFPNVSF